VDEGNVSVSNSDEGIGKEIANIGLAISSLSSLSESSDGLAGLDVGVQSEQVRWVVLLLEL